MFHLTKEGTEKLADQIAQKLEQDLGRTPPVRRIRNSQILSAVIGVIGFSLFVSGVDKITTSIPGSASIILGIVLMTLSGALLKNLWR